MNPSTDLHELLVSMRPRLVDGEIVFATMNEDARRVAPTLAPICELRETEGVTLVIRRADAEAFGIPFTYPCRQITLDVRSSLEAIGFLAAIAERLAAAGISVNVQSGYHHDHLFVPSARAEEALGVLKALSRDAAETPAPFAPAAIKPAVTMETIEQIDLRVGTILAAEDVPGSRRLMRLRVDLGAGERVVLAGIKQERANPREIVGRQALFYCNVPPRRMAGETSEGMLCDVGYADGLRPALLVPERAVPNGARAG